MQTSEQLTLFDFDSTDMSTCTQASAASPMAFHSPVCPRPLASLPLVSPVNPSALRASKKAPATIDTYGPSHSTPFAHYDHSTQCWRTLQACLLPNGEQCLAEYSQTWPKAAMMLSGKCYGLPTLTRRISVRVSGLLPTPTARPAGWQHIEIVDNHGNPPTHWNQRFYDKNTKRLVQKGLSQVVRMWPTPTTRDWKDGTAKSCQNVPSNGLLGRVVHETEDYQTSGSLNPQWVEWLMGYPTGWTDLRDVETP